MMFGSKRKKAIAAATDALRPIIATAQLGGGLSTQMYFDPYILGYMSSMASMFARAETKDKASAEDIGIALQTAFQNVCNINGEEAGRRAIEYVEEQNPEYLLGSEEATLSFLYTVGMIDETHDSQLMKDAVQFADSTGGALLGGTRETAVGGAMMQITFNARVKELRAEQSHA